MAFLLGAALFWAIYILANKNAGALVPGQGGLAVAFVVGGVAMLPMGAGGAWNLVSSTDTGWFAIGTGILGSLVPYSLELIALRGLAPNVFSILISLEPVFAAFFGWLLLAQNISTLKLVAIGVVIAASVVQTVGTGGSGANGAPRSKLKKLQDVGRKVVPRRRQ
ncbi:EamA family transporter [Corynebacterium propinquum]|uniref:EamA family transporter n=1 Tax=Corynebacterium propinquum TaxID=43769 RepID=UPI003C7FCFE0